MEFSNRLLKRLSVAYNVVVLTGAGVSAASGVPTFRGEGGLWKKFRPQELANFEAFSRNPELVWEWYDWRRKLIKNVRPNLAHYALVDLEKRFHDFFLITQNVDNLHQKAGSQKVIELHGNIMRNKCANCGEPYTGEISLKGGIPSCKKCNGLIRPDVVWFGEMLPKHEILKAQEVSMGCEVFFSIGTSSLVEPAASLPFMAKGNGAYVVEINTDTTPLTDAADELLAGPADKILPDLIISLEKYSQNL
ncbi:NAD-dependent protein deacylase [candidate division KSB1 bacterium 4484_188]|nr:MAG: NAD-dependent protein deacylase [candidate division KSB1 bacterium 4484_188]